MASAAEGMCSSMITADTALAIVGASLIVLALSSRLVKRHALSPMVLALAIGVMVGPQSLGLVDLQNATTKAALLEQTCRVALALSVFDIALRVRPEDLRINARRVTVLLLVAMPAMWAVTALGAHLLLGLPLALALLLAACLTPTDPGVASALVSGVEPNRSLPRRLRMTLQIEAAANDGLALPLVLLAGTLVTIPLDNIATAWLSEVARELGIAVVVGAGFGYGLRRLTDIAGVHRLAEEDWFPLAGAGVALTTMSVAHLLGGTGIFAAFVAGLFFSEGLPDDLRQPIELVHRSLTKPAVMLVFLVLGAVAPLPEWVEVGWVGVAFGVWVLLLRRFPLTYPAMRATSTGPYSSAYIGWSGPLGVAAIYYLVNAGRYQPVGYEGIYVAGTLAVVVSLLGQVVSATPLVRAYRRATGALAGEGEQLELDGPLP
jgi:NhaP-type Na+/H+ or K+/H+ antiporter